MGLESVDFFADRQTLKIYIATGEVFKQSHSQSSDAVEAVGEAANRGVTAEYESC
jgi:hypothetical protein